MFTANNQRAILAYPNFEKRLFDGVRLAQDIAYSIPDWTPVKVDVNDVDAFVDGILQEHKVGRRGPAPLGGIPVDWAAFRGDAPREVRWQLPPGFADGGAGGGEPAFQQMVIDDAIDDFDDAPDRHDDDEDDDF